MQKGRILVVDDNKGVQSALEMLLAPVCKAVNCISSPNRLVPILESGNIDLILLDMRMPRMNGWEFAEAYRTNCDPCTPIVVVTAATNAAQRASEIQAHGWLGKPFDVDNLIAVVQQHSPK